MQKSDNLTPMMRQYLEMKEQNEGCLLMFRLGDFYELFFEDAIVASKELEITLTGRDCGLSERAPMCGVPFHAVQGYVAKLIAKGYKVAICDQLSDPKAKGLVERGITRIITPGTVIDDNMLVGDRNNYIAAITFCENEAGLCYCDVSTGAFVICALSGKTAYVNLLDELNRIEPSEIIYPENLQHSELLKRIVGAYYSSAYDDHVFEGDYGQKLITAQFGTIQKTECRSAIGSAGALLSYLNDTQKNSMTHIKKIQIHSRFDCMLIDASTRRNLELSENMAGGSRKRTLLGLLSKTRTAMGARMLKTWLEKPLQSIDEINYRLDTVDELKKQYILRDSIANKLDLVYDLERLCSKLVFNTFNGRDAIALLSSVSVLPLLKLDLAQAQSKAICNIRRGIDDFSDVADLLTRAIAEQPPVSIKEGGIIKQGYNIELDQLRDMSINGRQRLREYENSERERTGIKNLKIGYNKVFGYFIEVTKSNLGSVPYYFNRKQTISTGERFTTDELSELQESILGAEEKSIALETYIFTEIRNILIQQISRFQSTASHLATLDVLQSLGAVANFNNYCKPEFAMEGKLQIINGRHPVVESASKEGFVANDTFMDNDEDRLLIITGPNMAGKSTYMRQIALITIMAHIGSFVPAESAIIPITDRVFARVGASDDLSSGRSTFMVEMTETANILQNATDKSLILLDEIGRGTSTYDGLSLAWAVVEFIASKECIGAKTLFATHFHELSELEDRCEGVKNYRIVAKEVGEEIVFIRKIMKGGTDKSFGIQVAKLAGVPDAVIERAKKIRKSIESADTMIFSMASEETIKQKNSIDNDKLAEVLKLLKNTDINTTTPLEALSIIAELKAYAINIESNKNETN